MNWPNCSCLVEDAVDGKMGGWGWLVVQMVQDIIFSLLFCFISGNKRGVSSITSQGTADWRIRKIFPSTLLLPPTTRPAMCLSRNKWSNSKPYMYPICFVCKRMTSLWIPTNKLCPAATFSYYQRYIFEQQIINIYKIDTLSRILFLWWIPSSVCSLALFSDHLFRIFIFTRVASFTIWPHLYILTIIEYQVTMPCHCHIRIPHFLICQKGGIIYIYSRLGRWFWFMV